MGRKREKTGCLIKFLVMLIVLLSLCLGVLFVMVFLAQDGKIGVQILKKKEAKDIPYQQVAEVQEEAEQKYYYGQLPKEEQTVYLEIAQGIREMREEIYVHSSDAERTNQIFHYMLKDYPDAFWCDGTATSTAYDGEQPYTVLMPQYQCDGEMRKQRQAEIDGAVSECLAGISADASEYEKILYVYEYIVNMVDYDLEAPDNQNIYSVFVNKRSVCAGYSRAAQYLLERLGVFCTYVTGTTDTGQPHAWNLVSCGGDYYYVDVTWGDPVFQEQEGTAEQINQNYVSYDYMCCDDSELFKTHTLDGDIPLPACKSMSYNYYVVNGMYYDSYDSQTALQAMNNVISAGGNPAVLKYSDSDVYWQAHDDIFQNVLPQAAQSLAQWYGLYEVRYSYVDDEKENKIVVYWEYSG